MVTLSPLRERPQTIVSPAIDRADAYFVLGLLFSLAYVRRWKLALSIVLLAALGFELAQILVPDRHARPSDAAVKMVGGALGFVAGWTLVKAAELWRRARKRM